MLPLVHYISKMEMESGQCGMKSVLCTLGSMAIDIFDGFWVSVGKRIGSHAEDRVFLVGFEESLGASSLVRFQNNWPVGYTIEEGEVGIFAKTFGVTEVIGHRNDQEIDGQTVQGRRRMKKYIFACSETHEPSNCTIAGQDRWRLYNLHTRGIYCGIEQCASSGPIKAPHSQD